jgi:RNA polymerase sigma-70 factor (ECF subfamily)
MPVESRDDAFARLALPQLPAIVRVARALTRDESDAEDLVQETFLRAFRHWHTFDQSSDAKRWLATICRNVWRKGRVKADREVSVDDEQLESYASAQAHNAAKRAGVDAMYARMDLGPAIATAITALEPDARDVVMLADVEGFAYEEIAELLDIPIGTVRSRLFRARRRLQQALIAYAIDAGFRNPPSTAPAGTVP